MGDTASQDNGSVNLDAIIDYLLGKNQPEDEEHGGAG